MKPTWKHTAKQWTHPNAPMPRKPWQYALVAGSKVRWYGTEVQFRRRRARWRTLAPDNRVCVALAAAANGGA